MLRGVGLDGEAHVARVLLGLGPELARVSGQLLLQPLGLDRGEPLELGCLPPRIFHDLLGGVLGGLEDAGDPLAEVAVAAARDRRLDSLLVAARALFHPRRGRLGDRRGPGKEHERPGLDCRGN